MSSRLMVALSMAAALVAWGCANGAGETSEALTGADQGDECTADTDCGDPGLECEDGFCVPQDEDGDEQGDECVADADCSDPSLECEDGFCVPHGDEDCDDDGDAHDDDGDAHDDDGDGHHDDGDDDDEDECAPDADCGDPAPECQDGSCVPQGGDDDRDVD